MSAKTLSQLEELDLYEQKQYADLKKQLDAGKIISFIKQVSTFSHEIVLKFTVKDPEFYQTFCHPELEKYWCAQTKLFNDSAENVIGMRDIHRSIFDIFLSYYLLSEYYRYIKEYGENNNEALHLLTKACHYQGIHALRKRVDFLVQRLDSINNSTNQNEEYKEALAHRCDKAMHEIADLWSPGLMEAARLALALGIYHLKYRDSLPPEQQTVCMGYYRQALRYIFLAQKLENDPRSRQATTVIYQERSILEMFRMTQWDEMIPWLLKHHPIKPEDINSALKEAELAYKKLENSLAK